MTKYKCSVCSLVFKNEDIADHADTHLEKTRGIDYEGNSIPSKETIVFHPIEVD